MTDNTIVGSGRVKFTKPGEKYHWVRETEWERQWEAEGLLPKRWAVASEPVVISTYRGKEVHVYIDNASDKVKATLRTEAKNEVS